jgi:hypothetical protein
MDENIQNKPEEQEENPEQTEPFEDLSLSDAITGIFTEPRNTFEGIKKSSKKNYWLIPILIFIVISVISRFMITNDEELYADIKTKQTEAVKKRLDEAVKDGKMSQDQANERMEQIDKGFNKSGPFFILSITLGPIIITFIMLFLKGLIFFGALKLLKGAITYVQIITVLGLVSIIDSIQAIVDTVLAIITGRLFANIGPILLFSKDSLSDKMSLFTAHFDVFNIWYFFIVGIGLAVFADLKSKQTIPIVFVLWLIWVCITSFLNLPFFGG